MKGDITMAIKHSDNSSFGRLSKGVSKLEGAFGQLGKAIHYDASRDATRLYPIGAFINQLRDVRICCSRLQEASNRSAMIAQLGAGQLSFAYEALTFALRPMGELGTADIGPLSVHPLFGEVREEIRKLGESVRLVMRALDQQAEADMEHSSYYEIPRILRHAVKSQDSRLVKNLRLTALDAWVVNFTELDWQNKKMVDKVAKIFVLDNYLGQSWELRYRSKLPGRPYVLMLTTVHLPGPDAVELYSLPPAEYYIAAKLPSWRIVWKMSWYDTF